METKSQLRLRSLDVGGRSIGTDRLSPVPSSGADFLRKLNQGLAEVQEEAESRHVAAEANDERASERSAQADRDQTRGADDRLARRAQGEEHVAERQAETREVEPRAGDDHENRAAERRAQERPRPERRQVEDAPSQESQTGEAPSEVPSAPNPAPPAVETSAPRPLQSPVATPNPVVPGLAAGGAQPAGAAATAAQPATAATAAAAATPRTLGASQPGATQPSATQAASAQAQRSEAAPRPTRVAHAERPAPAAQDLERADAVLRQVKVSFKPGQRAVNLQLHPAELGRITIRLRVQDEGVQAVVRAESEATLAVLDRHLPELRAILAQQGFEGAEFDLGMAGQSDPGTAQGDPKHDRGHSAAGPVEEEMNLDALALARPLAAAEGGVDLIV